MKSVSRKLQEVSKITVGILLTSIVVIVSIQIFFRNQLKISCVWADEIARYAFIWLTMIGASLQVKDKGHFVISLFIDTVKYKRIFGAVINAVMLIVIFAMILWGTQYAIQGYGTISQAAHIKMVWVYSAIPVSGLLMLFYIIEILLKDFSGISQNRRKDISDLGGDK